MSCSRTCRAAKKRGSALPSELPCTQSSISSVFRCCKSRTRSHLKDHQSSSRIRPGGSQAARHDRTACGNDRVSGSWVGIYRQARPRQSYRRLRRLAGRSYGQLSVPLAASGHHDTVDIKGHAAKLCLGKGGSRHRLACADRDAPAVLTTDLNGLQRAVWHSAEASAKPRVPPPFPQQRLFQEDNMATSNFRPLHDRVVVRRVESEEKTKAGSSSPIPRGKAAGRRDHRCRLGRSR